MGKETIRLWFHSPDAGLASTVVDALGPGFELRHSDEFQLNGQVNWWDVVMLDLREASAENNLGTGLSWVDQINEVGSPPPIIALLESDECSIMSRLTESGVFDIAFTPRDLAELRPMVRRAYKFRRAAQQPYELRSQLQSPRSLENVIGSSSPMQEVFALARKVAPCDVNVLIAGETGTGKELVARAIHRMSPRAKGPFVAFSAANLPETLIEDELFGHEKGAFTGALLSRLGRLEMADGGSLFLDEIGDLTLASQPKLLRVLQERTFERLGSNTPRSVNLRLLCATNRDLPEMLRQGKFREDLFYRLNVVAIQLPPLRERREDILLLAHYFLQRFARLFGKKTKRFARLALRALEEFNWPGNVRELENVVQRAVVLAEGDTIDIGHLPLSVRDGFGQPRLVRSYEEEVRDFKRQLILRTLCECAWSKAEAARQLQLTRVYIHRLIHKLNLSEDDPAPSVEPLRDPASSGGDSAADPCALGQELVWSAGETR